MNHIALLLSGDEREKRIADWIAERYPPICMSVVWQNIARHEAERAIDSTKAPT